MNADESRLIRMGHQTEQATGREDLKGQPKNTAVLQDTARQAISQVLTSSVNHLPAATPNSYFNAVLTQIQNSRAMSITAA
jgi:hypothetical protein